MMIRTILFDLDGTILDTNELIIASFLHALDGIAPQPLTRERVIPEMGRPLSDQLRDFAGRPAGAAVDDLTQRYRTYNFARHDELVREFPGVREVLAELHARGVKLGVVTSKIRKTTGLGLALIGVDRYIDATVTIDDVREPKPHPEGIQVAMAQLGADPATTLMVGDSQYDLLAAKAAGVRSAGVAWSLKGEAHLRTFEPDYMLQTMHDLLAIAKVEKEIS